MTLLRVLHVGPDKQARGGIASVLSTLSEHASLFERRNYTLGFVATTPTISSHAWLKALPFMRAVLKLILARVRGDVDIVHLHVSIHGSLRRKSILACVCACLRIPYVLHIHSGAFIEHYLTRSVFARFQIRRLLQRAASVVVLSKRTLDAMTRLKMMSPEKCHLVFNGIADPLKGTSPRREVSPQPITMTFLGMIGAAKGVPLLVSAVARMRMDVPKFVVKLGGVGDVAGLLDAIQRYNVASIVSYVGWLGGVEKAAALANTDIFVLPSRSEGFPVAIVEAMAYGTAIVSTAIPGVIDAIRDEVDGVLIPTDDAEALTASLERLVLDADERRRLGASARQRYLDTFTIDQMAAQLIAVYDGVCSNDGLIRKRDHETK